MTWLGDAVADGVHPLVHDVDTSFIGYSTGKNVVGEKGGRVGGDIVVHHFEIDGVFLLHGGDPALDFLAITSDIEEPVVAFVGQTVCGGIRGNGSAIHRDRLRAGEGAEARVDDVSDSANGDGEKHVLAHTFMARFEEKDARSVANGGEADSFERGTHKACVFEAIATASGFDNLGLQAFGVKADGAAEEDVEAFEGNVGDMGAQQACEGFVSRYARASVVDARKVSVEVQCLRHLCLSP